MSQILVVGASGTVGSELARQLTAQGEKVRQVTSRAPTAPSQVQVDLVSGAGLQAAFEGVDRAFLLCPPGHANQEALLAPLIDEARAHGLKKVVLMSAMGVNVDDAIPYRKAEKRLEASGLPRACLTTSSGRTGSCRTSTRSGSPRFFSRARSCCRWARPRAVSSTCGTSPQSPRNC